METWPSIFPKPQVDLQEDIKAQTVRTKTAPGLIQQRKRFSGTTNFVDVSWEMSDDVLGDFQSFRAIRLNLGTDWFLMPLALDDDETTLRTVRLIDGQYSISYVEVGYWKLSAKLDLLQEPYMSESDLDDILSGTAGLITDDGELLITDDGDSILLRL